ncbi:MAG: NAD(P)/FAD-dependent oxidoreductase [Gammaproteobacteria bacterium]
MPSPEKNKATAGLHHIVIVGGGAGGLELATRLGRKFGKHKRAWITLIDATPTHLWKPLLHEVAAGTLNSHDDKLSYLAQAYWNHFTFRLGRVDQVDRGNKIVSTEPALDSAGNEYIPRRHFEYDTLIMAVGSVSNHFSIDGVKEHCHFVDRVEQADRFHQHLLRSYFTADTQADAVRPGQLHIAIAGGGATGVELAAELYGSTRDLIKYGLDRVSTEQLKITIIDASDRILPGLPPQLSQQISDNMREIGIELLTGERINQATADGFVTASGKHIAAEIKVWAAGIKAPTFLSQIEGLETNRINQLLVHPTLQTTNDPAIFAFGDCAACPMTDAAGNPVEPAANVPPRAQAAHQQASLLVKSMTNILRGKPVPRYRYLDYGSLINMSRYSTVGSLMGNVAKLWAGQIFIEGLFARLVYLSLYKMHQLALFGVTRVSLLTVANLMTHKTKPRMKLH